jgi:hypothetical protein
VGAKFRPIGELEHDIQHEPPDKAPQVIFIEPRYFDFFWSDQPPNCNHPLGLVSHGEQLPHRVYTALTSNPAKWARTLLLITYDEHGGFFDHVPPLPIKNPVRSVAEALVDTPAHRPAPSVASRSAPPVPPRKRVPKAPNERAFQEAARELLKNEGPIATGTKYPDLVGAPLTS